MKTWLGIQSDIFILITQVWNARVAEAVFFNMDVGILIEWFLLSALYNEIVSCQHNNAKKIACDAGY